MIHSLKGAARDSRRPFPFFPSSEKKPVLHGSIIASAFLEPIKPFSHREAGFPAARFRFCFSFGSLESRFFQKTIEKANGKA
ncbi:hypothetical protein DWY99_02935 [[Clostridium] leptum]|uniref:Uncharacterized protein n=1 Tax=[Clostridium] leptum TaxID=1535 RepID=A0A412B053_9FIRM|nr:hypothetical protein DWY99_02935 [[Clostridium] leptum]